MVDINYSLGASGGDEVIAEVTRVENVIQQSADATLRANNAADSDRAARIRAIRAEAEAENANEIAQRAAAGAKKEDWVTYRQNTDLARDASTALGGAVDVAGNKAVAAGAKLANVFMPGISSIGEMVNSLGGSAGLVGALSAVGVAVTGVTYLLDHWFDKEVALEERARERTSAQVADVNATIEAYKRERVVITAAMGDELALDLVRKEARQKRLQDELSATAQEFITLKAGTEERAELLERRALLELQIKDNARNVEKAQELKRQATEDAFNEQEAQNGIERAAAIDAANAKRLEKQNAFNAENRAIIQYYAGLEAQDLADKIAAENEFNAIERQRLAEDRAAQLADEKADFEELETLQNVMLTQEDAGNKKREDEAKKEAASIEKVTDAIRKKNEALEETRKKEEAAAHAAAVAEVSHTAMDVAMMGVGATLGPVNQKLSELKDLNSENAKELLQFGNDAPAVYMKIAQGALIGVGIAAGGKAAEKAAEGVGALGSGAFELARGNPAGAAMMEASAPIFASAGMYAALAGTTVSLGVGIGAIRPPTNAEKASAKGAAGGAAGGGGGTGTLGGGGGDEYQKTGSTTYVNYFAAGAVAPQDDRRAGRHVARSVERHQRDVFSWLGNNASGLLHAGGR